MPTTVDPAMKFLRDHLLPLRQRGDHGFAVPQADVESYFSDCDRESGGAVREVAEDVPAMLEELVARWRATGRDDLASLDAALQEMAAALLSEAEDAEPLAVKTAGSRPG